MEATQRTKLLKLARLANFLDDLPHDRFHMPRWATYEECTETSCGTAGCAAGWAATVFSREGWRFADAIPLCGVWADNRMTPVRFNPAIYSFAWFFGVHLEHARWITAGFTNQPYDIDEPLPGYLAVYGLTNPKDITPRHAADRIRKVIAKYDATILAEAEGQVPELAVAQ
jgi:hypothetical protein